MQRDQVATRYTATKNAIEAIENSNDAYAYLTKDKYLQKVGYIHEIETIEDLLQAQTIVNENKNQKFEKAIEQLGLTEKEVSKKTEPLLMGMKNSHWEKDIKTRLTELRTELRLKALKNDLVILERHLNDDDFFAIDSANLSDEEF